MHSRQSTFMEILLMLNLFYSTGDRGRQRTRPGDELTASQGRRKTGVRGHKSGGCQGDGLHDQRPTDRWRYRGGLLYDQRCRAQSGERASQNGGREVGKSGRTNQQCRYCGQLAVNGRYWRYDQAHDRCQPGIAFLGECHLDSRSRILKYSRISITQIGWGQKQKKINFIFDLFLFLNYKL